MSICSYKMNAQNIQLHYDMERNYYTSTVEMFRPDAGGSTFFFVDMDYNPRVSSAYWEISREICYWQDSRLNWLSAHIEYNGGLSTGLGSFNNAWLAGATYSGHSADFSKTWSATASYKATPGAIGNNEKKQPHGFQITAVWNLAFFNRWISFDGFIDYWYEGSKIIFMSEPQLWVNLQNIKGWEKVNLSIGSEVELSSNFYGPGMHIMPTVAAKWTF